MPTMKEVIEEEARFINYAAVAEQAAAIIDRIRALFSNERYAEPGETLAFSWLSTDSFRAWAAVRPGPPPTDEIAISYGAATEVYRDAFVLPLMCERHFNTPQYETIYSRFAFGDGIVRVLPAGLTASDATVRIMNGVLAWLYLHEQSHLFQMHGAIAGELGASWASGDQKIDEMRDLQGPLITGRSAALSHVFELAADHEAMNNIMGLIQKTNGDSLPAHSLWTLIVGLTCMFHRFYGDGDRTFKPDVEGSHPVPSFRMRVLLRYLCEMMMHPDIRKLAPWIRERADVEDVLGHAVITATMYFQIRYRDKEAVSEFLKAVQGHGEVPVEYQKALFDVWAKARPMILKDYRGWGDACVLDIPSMAYLS